MLTYPERQEVLLLLYHARLEADRDHALAWIARAQERLAERDTVWYLLTIERTIGPDELGVRLRTATALLEVEQGIAALDREDPCAASQHLLMRQSSIRRTLSL